MTAQYVQIQNGVITAVFGGPQAVTADKPGYAVIDSTAAAFVAWQSAQAAQAAFGAALASGVPIASTGTPALDGAYALDAASRANIASEQVYIATTGKFTNGQTTRAWPDLAGAMHVFPSPAEFTSFAEAAAQYYDALLAALDAALQNGTAWVAPAAPAALP